MIHDFRSGAAAKLVEKLTQKAIEAGSVYAMPPMEAVRREAIELDVGRFLHARGEDRFLMFAYLPSYETKKHGALPKFHTHNCDTRQTYTGYVFSARMPVTIRSKDEGKDYRDISLVMCRNCASKATRALFSWGALPWYEYVLQVAMEKRRVMSNGYIDLWKQLSEAVRVKAGWTCQQCQAKLPMPDDAFYLEVHHRDGDKTNNKESNLIALCVECHSQQDDRHRQNYASGSNRLKLDRFKERYR